LPVSGVSGALTFSFLMASPAPQMQKLDSVPVQPVAGLLAQEMV